MKKIILSVLVISIFTACGSDPSQPSDCDGSVSVLNAASAELQAWQDATTALSTSPSPENCQKFKDAGNAYLDALQEFEECAEILNQKDLYDEQINNARKSINETNC